MKVRKELLGAINETFMNLNYPLLSISVFIVAIIVTKVSLAVPTALAILQLLNSLNESSRSVPSFISEFTEFLISMERIQAFLQCEELEAKSIKYDKNEDTSISIKDGHFFWGFQTNDKNDKTKSKTAKKRSKICIKFHYFH